MRILNPKSLINLEDLGLRKDLLETFQKEIEKPNGMIIVTGPTGSGKTTTLYAFLKKIQNPPQALYARGQIPQGPYFAIVGTRRCSAYGKQVALEISADLASVGLIIVSGMAKGIDTMAHQACLEANGETIAVLGTGLDDKSIYPQENLFVILLVLPTL